MPFHDITELPPGFCNPETTLESELSTSNRIQITELLHRIYLCEDSRDYEALKQILVDDYINEHPLFGKHESASSFIVFCQMMLCEKQQLKRQKINNY